ncbi:Organic cation transporter protein [Gryllus bimaculatus]|nr:Organic cation transporter protein [Gryllus bimaculatus]
MPYIPLLLQFLVTFWCCLVDTTSKVVQGGMAQGIKPIENGKGQEYPTELEDALYITGTGKFHNLLLFSCGIGLIGVMMETFGVSFLIPSAQCDFNLSTADKGLLNAVYPVGMICGSHMWGYLADTRGRKKALVASYLLDGLCAIISSFIPIFWIFLTFRFICGFLISGASSVIYAYFGEFHATENRNKGLMWLSVFIGIAICAQPGIAWLIIPQTWVWHLPWCLYKSWRVFIVICALPTLLAAIVTAFCLPETPKFLMAVGKKDEALNILRNMYVKNSGNSVVKYPVNSIILTEDDATQVSPSDSGSSVIDLIVHMWNQTVPLFKTPFLWKTLLVCFVQYGLYASSNGLSLWLPDIFNHQAAYFSIHPDARVSTCQIYNTIGRPIESPNVSQPIDISLKFMKPTTVDLHTNDTLSFACENSILILNVNNVTQIPVEASPIFLNCFNNTFLHNFSDNILQIEVQGNEIILTALNTPHFRNLIETKIEKNPSVSEVSNSSECNNHIDISAFQNTLIIGAAGAISFVIVGFLIGPLGKKPIIMASLFFGGLAGLLLDYVNADWEFFLMALAFVTLSGMCIAVTVSVVVEIFPTNLRAMAVCLSLMCGRLGSFTAHMLMGVLLETNCLIMTFVLGGLCACCGIISVFLPSPKKSS